MTDFQALQQRIDALEHALASQRRDMQHHVRNLLAVVRSVSSRTGATSGANDHAFPLLDGRLAAFGRVQSVILRDDDNLVELGALIADELLAHGVRIDRLALPETPIWIRSRAAVLLVLVWHELIGFTDTGALIDVDWRRGDTDSLQIVWRSAVLPEPARPNAAFLTEILERALPYEARASASLTLTDGVECTVTLPAEAVVERY